MMNEYYPLKIYEIIRDASWTWIESLYWDQFWRWG